MRTEGFFCSLAGHPLWGPSDRFSTVNFVQFLVIKTLDPDPYQTNTDMKHRYFTTLKLSRTLDYSGSGFILVKKLPIRPSIRMQNVLVQGGSGLPAGAAVHGYEPPSTPGSRQPLGHSQAPAIRPGGRTQASEMDQD